MSDYQDPGATANDAEDGDITSKIVKTITKTTTFEGATLEAPVENIPLDEEGEYTISYNVKDNAGASAPTITRNVYITRTKERSPQSTLPAEYKGVYDKNNFWLVQRSSDEPTHSTTGTKDGYRSMLIANSTASSSAVSNNTGIGGLSPSKLIYSYRKVIAGAVTNYSSLGASVDEVGHSIFNYISNTEAVNTGGSASVSGSDYELLTTKRSDSYEVVSNSAGLEYVNGFIKLKVPSDIYQDLQNDPGCGVTSHYGWDDDPALKAFQELFVLGGCPRGYAEENTEGLFKLNTLRGSPWISSSSGVNPWTSISLIFPGATVHPERTINIGNVQRTFVEHQNPFRLNGRGGGFTAGGVEFLGNNTVKIIFLVDFLFTYSSASLYGGVNPTRDMKINYILENRLKSTWMDTISTSDTVSPSNTIPTLGTKHLSKMEAISAPKVREGGTSLNNAGTGSVGTVRRGHRIGSMNIGWYSSGYGQTYTRASSFTMGSGANCLGSNASYYNLVTDPLGMGQIFTSANNPAITAEQYNEIFDLALEQSPLVPEHKTLFRSYGKPGGQGRVRSWKLPYAGQWDMYSIVKEV